GRADIWSLGTILFEALAGRPPFLGDSVMHVASRIFNEAPTPIGELRPDLPPELCDAIMRCLRKKPEERFPDVRALAHAIAPHAPAPWDSAERVARIVAGSKSSPEGRRSGEIAADSPKTEASRPISAPSASSASGSKTTPSAVVDTAHAATVPSRDTPH